MSLVNAGGASSSSSITSTSYHSVKHKKNPGTVILNDEGFTFYPIAVSSQQKSIAAAALKKENTTNGTVNNVGTSTAATAAAQKLSLPWILISKHQVSPVTFAKPLLKFILLNNNTKDGKTTTTPAKSNLTFELSSREELQRIRKDVSNRLINARRVHAWNNNNNGNSRKRTFEQTTASSSFTTNNSTTGEQPKSDKKKVKMESSSSPSSSSSLSSNSSSFLKLTDTALTVTRSSLLSSDPTLRLQHSLLVLGQQPPGQNANTSIQQSPILSENDFWKTHSTILANHFAKIKGAIAKGLPSTLKSSLDLTNSSSKKNNKHNHNPLELGVEEMRQIFISYPAVHRAYEAMVPLELSEEQFWRKWLESEYFHRDRGRLGTHFTHWNATGNNPNASGGGVNSEKKDEKVVTLDGESNGNNAVGGEQQQKQDGNSNAGEDRDSGENKVGEENTSPTDNNKNNNSSNENNNKKNKKEQDAKTTKEQEENARVAAASSNDIFSRAELERRKEEEDDEDESATMANSTIGYYDRPFAVGQFDLVSTANTERGSKLLLHSTESTNHRQLHHHRNHLSSSLSSKTRKSSSSSKSSSQKSNLGQTNKNDKRGGVSAEETKGDKVISKYNRHWAIVLNPKEATAGKQKSNLLKQLARNSTNYVLKNDDTAKVGGGVGREMERLVSFADAEEGRVDHVKGLGDGSGGLFEELQLNNVAAYSGEGDATSTTTTTNSNNIDKAMKNKRYVQTVITKQMLDNKKYEEQKTTFPKPKFGRELLSVLSKQMQLDSVTEKDAVRHMVKDLDETFCKKLTLYFRRTTELLRHFFALRSVVETEKKKEKARNESRMNDDSDNNGDKKNNMNGKKDSTKKSSEKKIAKIVKCMEEVYREMETMRNDQPSETMREMCFPIMNQLDFAFKLSREDTSRGAGGSGNGNVSGFVTVQDD